MKIGAHREGMKAGWKVTWRNFCVQVFGVRLKTCMNMDEEGW